MSGPENERSISKNYEILELNNAWAEFLNAWVFEAPGMGSFNNPELLSFNTNEKSRNV
jgi:hypothetical protein